MFDTIEDGLMGIFIGICGLFVILTMIFLSYCMYDIVFGDKIELNKADWFCIDSRQEIISTTILVGNQVVPQVNTVTECIEYKRRY